MHNKTVCPVVLTGVDVAEKVLETRDHLLEGLFIDGTGSSMRVEVNFIDAFSKKPSKAPPGDTIGYLADKSPPLI
jgi:hypothetical protein